MDSEYITERKAALQAEYDGNAGDINKLQARQVWLQGAYAELTEAEKSAKPKKKESK
jgi:hypothetical protein